MLFLRSPYFFFYQSLFPKEKFVKSSTVPHCRQHSCVELIKKKLFVVICLFLILKRRIVAACMTVDGEGVGRSTARSIISTTETLVCVLCGWVMSKVLR